MTTSRCRPDSGRNSLTRSPSLYPCLGERVSEFERVIEDAQKIFGKVGRSLPATVACSLRANQLRFDVIPSLHQQADLYRRDFASRRIQVPVGYGVFQQPINEGRR